MGKETRTEKTTRNSLGRHVSKDIRRRQMKPITEKIRRERINNSLHQLKLLVLSAMNKDVLQYAKMEKADILDMAVKYIRCLQTVKQESRDGCLRPTQGNPAPQVSPADKSNTNDALGQTIQNHLSETNVDLEASCSGMLSLVQPEIPQTYPKSVSMETQKARTSPPINTDYVPSSSFSNVIHLASMTTTWGNNASNCTNMSSSLYSKSSIENLDVICRVRSPLAEKEQNTFSTDNDRNILSAISEKRKNTSKERRNVRLPGMECFVRENFMAERLNVCKKTQIFDGYTLANQQREFQIDQFENSQYSLPLWRPW